MNFMNNVLFTTPKKPGSVPPQNKTDIPKRLSLRQVNELGCLHVQNVHHTTTVVNLRSDKEDDENESAPTKGYVRVKSPANSKYSYVDILKSSILLFHRKRETKNEIVFNIMSENFTYRAFLEQYNKRTIKF